MPLTERTQVLLSPAQRDRAERIAAEKGMSVGAVLRAALDAYGGTDSDERQQAADLLFSIDAPTGDWADIKVEIVGNRKHAG